MQNLPSKYIAFVNENGIGKIFKRAFYEIKKSSGILKWQNPTKVQAEFPVSKSDWLTSDTKYLFASKNTLQIPQDRAQTHQLNAQIILSGRRRYFYSSIFPEPKTERWFIHPIDHYKYDKNLHWTNFKELSPKRDIKYIWETSRFCYLYDIIRYDYHFNKDYSAYVLEEINAWIDDNKFNCGPHFISSQEIALRILNWLFAIYYYSDSPQLTDVLFKKILQSIYAQIGHIASNLSFSQNFVRNNHLITEASAMFVFSVLFPQVKESVTWLNKSKTILEKEIAYQIFEDGTYLQYSMNYHRIIIQLLTLNFIIAKNNNIAFSNVFLEKALLSLRFLLACTDKINGKLPNYGANDGSLFFPLNNNHYSDFRPQLQALANALGKTCFTETQFEDSHWFGSAQDPGSKSELKINSGSHAFIESGYYTYRDAKTFTFIRSGNHISRPSQADNLHIDLWYEGSNIMMDGGTFSYNTDIKTIRYFFGTASHNTILLGDYDQMLKGSRFIWYYKTKCIHAESLESDNGYMFKGIIKAFRQTGSWKKIQRTVIKSKDKAEWKIEDEVLNENALIMHQVWNPGNNFNDLFMINANDQKGVNIAPEYKQGYYSETYGTKTEIQQIIFTTNTNRITTIISLK